MQSQKITAQKVDNDDIDSETAAALRFTNNSTILYDPNEPTQAGEAPATGNAADAAKLAEVAKPQTAAAGGGGGGKRTKSKDRKGGKKSAKKGGNKKVAAAKANKRPASAPVEPVRTPDMLDSPAMENLYYIAHGPVGALEYRGFTWCPPGGKKKKKGGKKKKK